MLTYSVISQNRNSEGDIPSSIFIIGCWSSSKIIHREKENNSKIFPKQVKNPNFIKESIKRMKKIDYSKKLSKKLTWMNNVNWRTGAFVYLDVSTNLQFWNSERWETVAEVWKQSRMALNRNKTQKWNRDKIKQWTGEEESKNWKT